MADDDDVVMEEREELMVPSTGGDVCLRTAHFLKPSVTSIDGFVAVPSLSCSATPPAKYKDLPFKVDYHGWKYPAENWKSWVDQLHSSHHSTWKRAGIIDALMASKCIIHRCDDLILEFVEKWCPKTNSFVFPWGEATITLEDMMVLGGFSVLGESVLIPPGDGEMEEIVKKLLGARSDICKSKARQADKGRWVAQFMGSGSEIEHEAFLAYWLSRFVFPCTRNSIGNRSVLSIAVHLARGTQIALAPSILASIYKSLTFLKAAIVAARKSATMEAHTGEILHVTVPAPLAFVQVWVWERFPSLRPKPESIGKKEPRLSLWHNLKLGSKYRSMTVDSDGNDFQWRPYTRAECNVFPGIVYKDYERWEMVDSDLDEDLKGFVRCLRTSELVGLEGDCIEHYLPHRVAMQFGMDQDLPGHVARVNVNPEIAWRHYTRPIRDARLYVPPRISEPCVTSRYLTWWKSDVADAGANGKSSCEDSDVEKDLFGRKSEGDFFTPPSGFFLKWKKVQKAGALGNAKQVQDQIVLWESPLCSFTANNGGKGSSKSSKKRNKFVESTSGERSDYGGSDPPPGGKGSSKSLKKPKKFVESSSGERLDYNDCDVPPGFSPKHIQEKASHLGTRIKKEVAQISSGERLDYNDCDVPPGFSPKYSQEKASHLGTRIKKEVAQPSSIGSYGNYQIKDDAQVKNHSDQSEDNAQGNIHNDQSPKDAQGENHSSSTAKNGNIQEETLLVEPVEPEVKGMLTEEAYIDRPDEKTGGVSPSQVQGNASEPHKIELEERITTIEKLMALLKEGKLVCLR